MTRRLADDVRRAVLEAATDEARRRGAGRVSTQDLLLAALRDPASQAASILGAELAEARAAVGRLDREALVSVGVDPGAIELAARSRRRGARRAPLTAGARAMLARAVRLSRAEHASRVQMRHLVLALLATDRPDAAVDVLDELGIDREEARARANG